LGKIRVNGSSPCLGKDVAALEGHYHAQDHPVGVLLCDLNDNTKQSKPCAKEVAWKNLGNLASKLYVKIFASQ